jgi:hypothetical protein
VPFSRGSLLRPIVSLTPFGPISLKKKVILARESCLGERSCCSSSAFSNTGWVWRMTRVVRVQDGCSLICTIRGVEVSEVFPRMDFSSTAPHSLRCKSKPSRQRAWEGVWRLKFPVYGGTLPICTCRWWGADKPCPGTRPVKRSDRSFESSRKKEIRHRETQRWRRDPLRVAISRNLRSIDFRLGLYLTGGLANLRQKESRAHLVS